MSLLHSLQQSLKLVSQGIQKHDYWKLSFYTSLRWFWDLPLSQTSCFTRLVYTMQLLLCFHSHIIHKTGKLLNSDSTRWIYAWLVKIFSFSHTMKSQNLWVSLWESENSGQAAYCIQRAHKVSSNSRRQIVLPRHPPKETIMLNKQGSECSILFSNLLISQNTEKLKKKTEKKTEKLCCCEHSSILKILSLLRAVTLSKNMHIQQNFFS